MSSHIERLPKLLTTQTRNWIEVALSSCVNQPDAVVKDRLKDVIRQLVDIPVSFEQLHKVHENRSGYNLASLAVEAGCGWSIREGSVFRQLVLFGFNTSHPDAAGRVPDLRALEVSRQWMTVEDFQWAFDHSLDALEFYPDTHTGQSLLSVDFYEGHPPELVAYLETHLQERLLALEPAQREGTMTMLQETSLDCYAPLLANLSSHLLTNATPITPRPGTARRV